MRPGIWYLILASGYLAISLWSLYFVCTMYIAVQNTLCKSAVFVDTINIGEQTTDEDSSWIGVQKLGKQINIFINEATITKSNYEVLFTETINA